MHRARIGCKQGEQRRELLAIKQEAGDGIAKQAGDRFQRADQMFGADLSKGEVMWRFSPWQRRFC
ncbi:MAG: hypothetical protein ACK5JT_06900 [Hyphomicrobiaceae bacterium]